MKKQMIAMALCLLAAIGSNAKDYTVKSPDQKVVVTVTENGGLSYNLSYDGQELVKNSPIGLTLNLQGKTVAAKAVKKAKTSAHKGTIQAVIYKKNVVEDNYNELALTLNDGVSLLVRAYDDGAAYRFVSTQKKDYVVENEQASFNFAQDWSVYMPYTNSSGTIEQQYRTSFENTYTHTELSKLDNSHLAFIPFIVEAENDVKVVVSEADLEDYPGMFVLNKSGKAGVEGVFAPYPKDVVQGGHNKLQLLVKSRENYIAKGKKGVKNMPWRIFSISTEDKQLLNDDMVYRLASTNRIGATDWIKPGKVAWEWWNCWGVYNVNFTSGINNETYKYYIDFASKYGIEYVILDEGWAVNLQADLFQIVPEIDLKGLVDYAKSKNVGIILWAGWYAFERDMERVCKEYSEMGVKGFKVDFMDRDDALMVSEIYKAAEVAAKYKLMLDFHGMYKPTGLQRTYPNVINFEGVAGLEQNKWSKVEDHDQVTYDVVIPFARMLAGPMDYTQGAMLNATKGGYRPNYYEPMSQGTRVHQLAEYTVFLSPLNMLCDSPTHYEKESECTSFIAQCPVVWDETVPLESKIGEYVAVARRSGNTWYIAAINNWKARFLTLDVSSLNLAGKTGDVFTDGYNAGKIPSDYRREKTVIPADGKLKIHMHSGGGYVMKVQR